MAKKHFIVDHSGLDSNLYGGKGIDIMSGLDGDDILFGKGGNDVLYAGPANDYDAAYGGKGADTFAFATGDGGLQIEDFSRSDGDRLDLHLSGFNKQDLKDTFENDRDGDGYYARETSANGKPEVQLHFPTDNGVVSDAITIVGISLKQLKHDVKDHPGHYDFA